MKYVCMYRDQSSGYLGVCPQMNFFLTSSYGFVTEIMLYLCNLKNVIKKIINNCKTERLRGRIKYFICV